MTTRQTLCRAAALLLVFALTTSLGAQQLAAQEEDKEDEKKTTRTLKDREEAKEAKAPVEESDTARRKRMARLGSGRINYGPPVGKVHSLEAVIERAMEVNPQVVAEKYSRMYAELRQREADWAFFPDFQLDSRLTYVPNNPDFNDAGDNIGEYLALDIGPLFQTSLRIVVPITTFGKISNLEDLAQLGVDQAEIEDRKLRLEIIRKVKEAYLSVQLGKLLDAISKDGTALIKEEIDRLDEARDFGDEEVDIVEFRKLQIYDAELDTKAIDSERLIRLTKTALGVLVGLTPTDFDVVNFNEDIDTDNLPTLATCLEITKQNRPDSILLEKAIAARRHQVNLAVAGFYPDLYFAIDTGFSVSTVDAPNQMGFVAAADEDADPIPLEVAPFTDPFNYTRLAFALGMRLKVNPANQYWKIQQAKTKLAETSALQEAAVQGIELDVTKQWVETNDHRRKVEVLERRLKAAERWRNQIAIAFQSGGAEFKDFISPLKAYYEARLKLVESKYNYLVAMAHLAEKMGVTDIQGIARDMKK